MGSTTLVFVVAATEGHGVRLVIAVFDRDCLDRWQAGYPGVLVGAPAFSRPGCETGAA